MIYREYQPSKALKPYVKCIWTLRQSGGEQDSQPEPVFPDGCPEIVFNLAEPFRRHHRDKTEIQPRSLVIGQMNRFVAIEPTAGVDLLGIRFEPFGLFPFCRFSVESLTDLTEDIEGVFGAFGKDLDEMIRNAPGTRARIEVIDKMFVTRVTDVEYDSRPAALANDLISRHGGNISVGMLAGKIGENRRGLERRFKAEVGISPKKLCRITRFQHSIRMLNSTDFETFVDTAISGGYFDQSHFINDFKAFAGLSPREYLRRNRLLTDVFTG